jgi:hypothetical protein
LVRFFSGFRKKPRFFRVFRLLLEFIVDFRKKFGSRAKLPSSQVFVPDLHFLGYFVMLELLNTIEILS